MSQIWIMTQKKQITTEMYSNWQCEDIVYHFRDFVRFFEKYDVHKWQVGLEKGKGGLIHYQARFMLGTKDDFTIIKQWFPTCHLEWGDNWSDYETKEGHYITSEDNNEKLKIRYGRPNLAQTNVLARIGAQNDRQIMVWYDAKGNSGKSWLANWLYETRKGFYVPPNLNSKTMVQHVADGYKGEPIIVIDIPRTAKWTNDLYIAIEMIKDGLVTETRYHSTIRSVRGAKILVLTNSKPHLDKFSRDRWTGEDGKPLS